MAFTPTTWNPADKGAGVTLSGGDLTASASAGGVRSVFGATSGKFYWEVTIPDIATQMVGVGTELYGTSGYPGEDAESWVLHVNSGAIYSGGAVVVPAPAGYTSVSIVSVLLDIEGDSLTFWLDGDSLGGDLSISLLPRSGLQLFAAFGLFGDGTANFGATAFAYTPPVGYLAGLGFDPVIYALGSKHFQAGSPAVIRGPNRVASVTGLAAAKLGTPTIQPGYPITLLPDGLSVLSAGTPTVLPYSNRAIQAAGKSLFQAGFPTVAYNPIIGGTEFIAPAGVRVLSAGTPAMGAAATIEAQGAAVFSAGSPAAKTSIGVSGASLLVAGTPAIGAGVSPAGVALLRTGVPKLAATVSTAGKSVFRAGVPALIAGDFVVQPSGAAVFSAGLPRISNTTIHPWGRTHLRTGTPKATRSATC